MHDPMKSGLRRGLVLGVLATLGIGAILAAGFVGRARPPPSALPPPPPPDRSAAEASDPGGFAATMKRMSAARPGLMKRQQNLLAARYDLSDRPSASARMTRGKPLQEGTRVRLPKGQTWESLAELTPEQIRSRALWAAGFLPLPHPNHKEGGMLFPARQIDEVERQERRSLTRFDLDFDLPDHLMPEFPPAIYLTTHPERGDVSQGKVVTLANFYDIFHDILTPKQLDGLRLLLTTFPQQQFNPTFDRRTEHATEGVACLDCHVNGHTNGATHLVGDTRPQEVRHRVDTPTLRGVNVQRLFGSQRALKTVEDFTEFEQRGAYFDGDISMAALKGVNVLERGSEVHDMGEFQELLDFPPAPRLDVFGRLDPSKATEQELRGEALFFGAARCGTCHPAPIYSDNLMHDLRTARFFEPVTVSDHLAVGDGPIKTFPLRGIKDSPPYLHDGRLLTLEDTVEFFNLVLGTRLNSEDKAALVAFLRAL
jgi:cytochrome c peroxidase